MLFWHILTHRLLCMHDVCPIQFLSRRFSASPAHLADYVHMELLHGRHRMEADAEWCNCSPGFISDPCVCHVLQRLMTSHKPAAPPAMSYDCRDHGCSNEAPGAVGHASTADEATDLHVQQQWDMLLAQSINDVQPCTR